MVFLEACTGAQEGTGMSYETGWVPELRAWADLFSAQRVPRPGSLESLSGAFFLPTLGFKDCRTLGCLDTYGGGGQVQAE